VLGADEALEIVSQHDNLVVFGDGIEHDALQLTWGQRVVLRRSERTLRLVRA
jgi:hypothetical protein